MVQMAHACTLTELCSRLPVSLKMAKSFSSQLDFVISYV